jgi:hypothetical protein
VYLVVQANCLTPLALSVLVIGNWLHKTDLFFLLPLMPFRLWLMGLQERRLGLRIGLTLTERLFVLLCNKRAQRLGIELQWDLYDQAMRCQRGNGQC